MKRSVKMNLRELGTILWERVRGYDFTTFVEADALGLDPWLHYPYMKSGKKFMLDTLKRLPITADDRALDVGAGKGYGIYLLSRFPFAAVDGVEISERLVEIARRNLKRAKIDSKLFVADATTFDRLDDYTFFYLSNPFPQAETERFFQRFAESLRRKPRRAIVVYLNPQHGRIFEEAATRFETYWGRVAHIDGVRQDVFYFEDSAFANASAK